MKDDGGSAFPDIQSEISSDEYHNHFSNTFSTGGMTLRDYFAIHVDEKSIVVLDSESGEKLINRKCSDPSDDLVATAAFSMAVEARLRYMFADAMLEARKL